MNIATFSELSLEAASVLKDCDEANVVRKTPLGRGVTTLATARSRSRETSTMLIEQLQLTNFLSFGPNAQTIRLRPLSVFIGPNGAGKSNVMEAIDFLRNVPADAGKPVREGGGVAEWIWKGEPDYQATIEAVVKSPSGQGPTISYAMTFAAVAQRFQVVAEHIGSSGQASTHYRLTGGSAVLKVGGEDRHLGLENFDFGRSILAQRRDPDLYPEITYLADAFSRIRIYREWIFGRNNPARLPQRTDLPNDYLEPDGSNLALVLNRLRQDPAVKARLLEELKSVYEGIDDFDVRIEGGTVQVLIQEGRMTVPASRLSDGALRYLCLLAILCHPSPPPLVCIEEPELGLHPDLHHYVARLLREASMHSQLLVTTHSNFLLDALSDSPESVYVCDKDDNSTSVRQLSRDALAPLLEKEGLSQLWASGELGGTRW